MPCLAVVHALEDGHRVGLRVAKLQTDVSQLVLLAQAQDGGHILVVVLELFRHPACQVVRIIEIGEILARMAQSMLALVAYFTILFGLAFLVYRHETMPSRTIAAFT